MILECERCETLVEAEVLASYIDQDSEEPEGKWTFTRCPKCSLPMLAVQSGDPLIDDLPTRVFPPLIRHLGMSVPRTMRTAYSEAQICFRAKAFTASAIMCRKVLEGLCNEHGITERGLAASLKKLRENGIIESRLFEWAEELRTLGNEAAHGVNASISKQDANDIIEFTEALVEYVFTYRDKFEEFKKRRAKPTQPRRLPPKPGG